MSALKLALVRATLSRKFADQCVLGVVSKSLVDPPNNWYFQVHVLLAQLVARFLPWTVRHFFKPADRTADFWIQSIKSLLRSFVSLVLSWFAFEFLGRFCSILETMDGSHGTLGDDRFLLSTVYEEMHLQVL